MKVINKAQPFNVGDVIMYQHTRHTVASWRPGIDVHAVNERGQSVTVGWHAAELRLVPRQ